MDVREKLVEQLREVASKTPPICRYDNPDEIEHFGKTITVYCKPFEQFQELMRDAADYIANGVTVQEWVSVDDSLPRNYTPVLAYIPSLAQTMKQTVHECHIGADGEWHSSTAPAYWEGVTHWMPLPEPPEEVLKGDEG